jgi:hypothetical protein
MRAGDVVVLAKSLANTHRDGFLPDVEVSESGHERSGIEIVNAFFKKPDR